MRLFLLFAGLIFLGACVSNRKIVMLQKDDVKTKDLPKDQVVRTYAVDTFQYKVQTNDILSVRFESITDKQYNFFSNQAQGQQQMISTGNALMVGELVDENGDIPFPVVGKINVSGLTVFQIQDKLQTIAGQYLESPIVKVRLLNYRITVLGEVKTEHSITLTNNRVSMIEAIGLAGGFGDLADRSNVKLIRQKGAKVDIQYIDLLDENFITSPYYYVYQNDVLIVRPLRQRPFRNYFGTNLGIVASTISLLFLAYTLARYH
jgi:polysaccharide export outer membrane protein